MSISHTHHRSRRGLTSGSVLTVAGLALALVVAGCDTGDEGPEPPTDEPSTSGSPEPSEDPTAPRAALSDWVEVPAGAIVVAAAPGMAVLAVGEPTHDGQVATRDIAAYDPAGAELWTFPGAIEDYYLPTVMATDAGVAVLTPDGDSAALTMLDWADGSELWTSSAEDLGSCHEWRFADLPDPEVLTLTADGVACPGTEPDRAGAITIDPADGSVREEHLPSSGTIASTTAKDAAEVWTVEVTDAELSVQRFEPVTGSVDARQIGWDAPLAEQLRPQSESERLSISQVDADLAIVQRWGEEGLVASALLDWTTDPGSGDPLQPADAVQPCFGQALVAVDASVAGCLRVDLDEDPAPVRSLGFDGEERWSVPGQAGIDMEVPARVGPVPVGDRQAWVVSTGDDLLTALDARTGEELWAVGEGEGAGYVTFGHISDAGVLVAAVTAMDGPQGQLLRIDVATGEELDRRDIASGWVSSTDEAAVLSSQNENQSSLLTLLPAG